MAYIATANGQQEDRGFSQCGINSLYTCLSYLGLDSNLDTLYLDIPANHDNKINFYQFTTYAKNKGLYIKPIFKPSPKDIERFLNQNSAAILQYYYTINGVTDTHIVALIKPFNKEIKVYDFPRTFVIKEEKLDEVLKHSDGVLILSKMPFSEKLDIVTLLWALIFICVFIFILRLIYLIYIKLAKDNR